MAVGKRRGQGEGTVFPRGTKWCAVLTLPPDATGKRRRRWRSGFANKREATAALAKLRTEAERGEHLASTIESVEAYLMRWLREIRGSVKATTWSAYDGEMRRHVIPRIGKLRLTKLATGDLTKLYSDLLKDGRLDGRGGLSPKSVRGISLTLGKALNDAEAEGLLLRNPRRGAKAPKLSQLSRAADLTWGSGELGQFLASLEGTPLCAFFRLAATTGMRRGEILGLRWSDIDFDSGRLALVRSVVVAGNEVVTATPKSGRGRSIHLDEDTVAILRDHLAMNQRDALRVGHALPREVFIHADGRPFRPHWVSKVLRERSRKLGLPDGFRLHDMRHLSATLAMEVGVPLKVVSERLGHSSISVTADIYSHVAPHMQQDAAEKLAAIIGRS